MKRTFIGNLVLVALKDQISEFLEVADDEIRRVVLGMRVRVGVLGHFQSGLKRVSPESTSTLTAPALWPIAMSV